MKTVMLHASHPLCRQVNPSPLLGFHYWDLFMLLRIDACFPSYAHHKMIHFMNVLTLNFSITLDQGFFFFLHLLSRCYGFNNCFWSLVIAVNQQLKTYFTAAPSISKEDQTVKLNDV